VRRATVVLILLLTGCGRLPNDEIIKRAKQCTDAGMSAEYLRDINGHILDVQCGPRREAERCDERSPYGPSYTLGGK
jgi:Zn-finger domain-containing protein